MAVQDKYLGEVKEFLHWNSHLIEFTKTSPFGLVIEVVKDNKILVSQQKSYDLLSIPRSINFQALVPSLIWLGIQRVEKPKYENIHEIKEMVWIYSFLKAKCYFPNLTYQQLCEGARSSWDKIFEAMEQGVNGAGLFEMFAATFVVFDHPSSEKLKRFASDSAFSACISVDKNSSFLEFIKNFGYVVKEGNGLSYLSPPRKRLVVHLCYGRIEGVMATEGEHLNMSVDELYRIAQWQAEDPLAFAEHDLDRPMGLTFNVNVNKNLNKHQVIYTLLVTDLQHWQNRHLYKGSSLGIYRGKNNKD